ncbi:hypothetical protein N7448_008827 [Penicillium atrosanguineum]|uniref:Uncharacterized protein n=1 Tax=Penicillium atrosanguineum TaxID=1132637 RepID=A0A9W9GS06_9EURO|nr:hypothetical protein N7448_008827 [Penicillium atrosanguineum]KAJ5330357.1 hypothetical protein N7476_000140 [Penicillium atrosanguineum]
MDSDPPPSPTGPGLESVIEQPPAFTPTVLQNARFNQRFEILEPGTTMALPLLLFPDGDTLVYIDPAPEDGPPRLRKPPTVHRIHSDRLLVTGSEYFKRRLGPRQQTRVRKQRGFPDTLPDGITYVLDLTPPTLEEEAIISMTEVSCPMEIRTWASSKHTWDLPSQCVGGTDETEMVEEAFFPSALDGSPPEEDQEHQDWGGDSREEEAEAEEEEEEEEEGEDENEKEQAGPRTYRRAGLPVEYSAARHRDGIEQVLHVLEGLNITLDTPCKLWTFFAVAKIFKVATVPAVGDLVSSWFYMANNMRFVEIHPQIAYRVACGIESQVICRNAFVGLVGDEALLYLIRAGRLQPLKGWEKYFARSRAADSLDDSEMQRVEYASKSFADEVIGRFLYLAGTEMTWLADLEEFQKLTQLVQDSPADKHMVLFLISKLREYIRYQIYRALDSVRDTWRSCDSVPPGHNEPYLLAFRPCDLLQRIIGKKFWMALLVLDLTSRETNDPNIHHSIADVGSGLLAFLGQDTARILNISHIWLRHLVDEFNNTVALRTNATTSSWVMAAQIASKKKRWAFNLDRRCPLPFANANISTSGNVPSTIPDDPTTLPFRPVAGSSAATDIDMKTSLPYRPAPPQKGLATSSSDSIEDELDLFARDMRSEGYSSSENLENRKFNLEAFFAQVSSFLSTYSRRLVFPYNEYNISLEATPTLTCLGEDQYQYLPLWAGGNDDKSGGVYTDHNIPLMNNGGFSAPGPAVHTGSGASTPCSFSEINPSDSMSTVFGASHHATYSHISDLMSVNSAEFAPNCDEEMETMEEAIHLALSDVESSVPSAQSTEEESNLDYDSDGAGTVTMGSPCLSDDIDIDMENPSSDDDLDVVEFELEDGSDRETK